MRSRPVRLAALKLFKVVWRKEKARLSTSARDVPIGGAMHLPLSGTGSNTFTSKSQSLGYVTLLAAITAISGFLFGFDTAVINGVLLLLRRQFALSNFQTEAAASSLLLGCLLGAAGCRNCPSSVLPDHRH